MSGISLSPLSATQLLKQACNFYTVIIDITVLIDTSKLPL